MNNLDKAEKALEYANGFPVRDAKDVALVAIANALVAMAEGREEIVRCRDCKMFDEHYLKCFRPVLYFDDDYMPHWTDETTFIAVTDATPDGFCAWGVRRNDERA